MLAYSGVTRGLSQGARQLLNEKFAPHISVNLSEERRTLPKIRCFFRKI